MTFILLFGLFKAERKTLCSFQTELHVKVLYLSLLPPVSVG